MYWGDYLGGTMHFSTFQHGCYLLLIAAYWQNGGPLPADMDSLARICRTSGDKLARYGNPILAKFTRKDGLLYHQRIENEIIRSSARQAAAIANGKAGGLAKSKLTTTTTTTTEERKKEDDASASSTANGANGHERPRRGTRLAPNWEPSPEGIEFCRQSSLDPAAVVPEFRDYWIAQPGSRGVKLDWEATFRNRCRQIAERQNLATAQGRRVGVSQRSSIARAAEAVIATVRNRERV